ncbi:MAG: FAD-dependent oxidoreductase [Bacillota bacterium]
MIIVGAGPAGTAAAIKLAQNNLAVLLIERGSYPGAKNMFGGTIYRKATAQVIPEFWKTAPLERAIVSEELWLMDTTSAVKLGFSGFNFATAPYNKFSVIRSKFDRWFAQQAVQAGAELLTNTVVEDLLYKKNSLFKNQVSGVKLDSGITISSDIVLLAEGAQAMLTSKAGLRDELEAQDFKLYIKEDFALSQKEINSRFNLEKGEGTIIGMLGYAASNVNGKGGLWTNKNSISLTLGANLDHLNQKGLELQQMMHKFKKHPLMKRLLKNAKLINYKALTIPHGGYNKIPQLYDHGVLVAGNAAMLVSGRRGTDLAMLSGIYAAEVITQAQAAQDFTAATLKKYENKIMNSFFVKDIKKELTTDNYYQNNLDIEFFLSKSFNEAAYKFFDTELISTTKKINKIKKETFDRKAMHQIITDLFYIINHFSVY